LRLSEKGILAGLALLLLAFSVIAVSRIFEAPGTAIAASWQAEVGFYLPFVLFTLVSTYHFLEWAKKHRRQAIVMMVVIVAITSVVGTVTANAPRPALNSLTLQSKTLTLQSEMTLVQFQREQASLQESIVKLRDALNSTPYFSTGFSALTLVASAAAVILVLVRMRRERRTAPTKIVAEPLITDIHAATPRDMVIQCYNLATRYLQLGGVRIEDSDTPLDAFARIKGFQPSVADSFWNLTLLFEEAKFSLHPISNAQADTASQYCKSISNHSIGGIR
jgi:hypothetical protein